MHKSSIKKIINKGTGVGGSKTNINGLNWEKITSVENELIKNYFLKIIFNKKIKYGYYYEKIIENKKVIYLKQSGFNKYVKKEFNIDIYYNPDEVFIIHDNDTYIIKILEKKNQNVSGSVEDKLKTGKFTRREYEKMFKYTNKSNFIISYAFCVSKYLQNKYLSNSIKYNIINEILIEDDIIILYGEDNNYFELLFKWIYN